MKYFFRIVSLLFLIGIPILYIYYSWNDKDYLRLIISLIVLISNIYVIKETFDVVAKNSKDNEDPIEYMRRNLK